MNKLLVAIAILAAPSLAAAEAVPLGYYGDAEPSRPTDPWKKLRFEGEIGALIGGQRIGYLSGFGGGLHVDAGLRRDRLLVFGEYDWLSVGSSNYADPSSDVRGFMHRLGANARYSLGVLGGHRDVPVRGDFWAELGVGHQQIYWHEGGKLGRKDLSFGLGAQATFKIGREKPKFVGVHYAVKMTLAKAPARKDEDPMCAGPCDEPTGPSPWDLGVFFNFGVPFGR